MKRIFASLVLLLLPLFCFAEDKLAQLPQPWVEAIHRITFEKRGESHEGQPVYFVVTCAYNGNEKRSYGWTPPAAVMEKLKSK